VSALSENFSTSPFRQRADTINIFLDHDFGKLAQSLIANNFTRSSETV
jgi:hypothetical protein